MIKTLTNALKDILGPKSDKVECAIDESIVDCDKLEAPIQECGPGHFTQGYGSYVGVPAPRVLKEDEWFGLAAVSDANMDYMEREYEAFKQDALNYYDQGTKESPNIHQEMYDLATKSGKTTTQLNPIGGSENFQGGSENVHR